MIVTFFCHLPCNYHYYSLSYIFGFPSSPLFKEDTYSLCIFCGDPLPTGRIMRGPQVHPFTVSFFLCVCVCVQSKSHLNVSPLLEFIVFSTFFFYSLSFHLFFLYTLLRTGREREKVLASAQRNIQHFILCLCIFS